MPNRVHNSEMVWDTDEEYVICNRKVYLKIGMELRNLKKDNNECIKHYYYGKLIRCQYEVSKEPSINQIRTLI